METERGTRRPQNMKWYWPRRTSCLGDNAKRQWPVQGHYQTEHGVTLGRRCSAQKRGHPPTFAQARYSLGYGSSLLTFDRRSLPQYGTADGGTAQEATARKWPKNAQLRRQTSKSSHDRSPQGDVPALGYPSTFPHPPNRLPVYQNGAPMLISSPWTSRPDQIKRVPSRNSEPLQRGLAHLKDKTPK